MKFEAAALLRRVEGASRVGDGAAAAAVRGRIGERRVQVAVCGVGERAARRAAERCACLASRGACGRVVWIGIAGALSPDLQVGDLVVGRTVMAPDRPPIDLDETLVGAAAAQGCRPGVLVTVPGLVVTASSRQALWRLAGSLPETGVDMESWAAARVLQRAGVPFAAVRAISDTAADGLPSWLERASPAAAGAGAGAGRGAGRGSGTGLGSGTGSGAGSGTGRGAGSGTGRGAGSGRGTGSGAGRGAFRSAHGESGESDESDDSDDSDEPSPGGLSLGPIVRGALMRPSALVPLAKIRLRAVRLGDRLAEVAAALA